jgi:hypothetical protein
MFCETENKNNSDSLESRLWHVEGYGTLSNDKEHDLTQILKVVG